MKYNRLQLLTRIEATNKHRKSSGVFLCDCGNEITAQISNVKSGNTKSCGCLKIESTRKHGMCETKTYKAWADAKNRCNNKKVKSYRTHGARGISMCEKWESSFSEFLKDMGESPQGTSLDRINNDGNYEPYNCRWATIEQQNRNTRTACIWFIDGERFESLREAAKANNVCVHTLMSWVNGRKTTNGFKPPKENCYKVKRSKA